MFKLETENNITTTITLSLTVLHDSQYAFGDCNCLMPLGTIAYHEIF